MRKRSLITLFVLVLMLACQIVPTPPALLATPRSQETPEAPADIPTPALETQELVQTPSAVPAVSRQPGELALIPYTADQPFGVASITDWDPMAQKLDWPVKLPAPVEQAANLPVVGGLTLRQRGILARDGFVIVRSQEEQFIDIHLRVSLYYGQPYLLTADAAYHALKLNYAVLLGALEREELQPRLLSLIRATYEQVVDYFPLVAGTDLESETILAAAYLGVALRLLDPEAALVPEVEAQVSAQVGQILGERGYAESRLLPGLWEDFNRYYPATQTHGEGLLEGYSRARAWLESVSFPVERIGPLAYASNLPLIVTLALRQAVSQNGPAVEEYARLMEIFDFIDGQRIGGGPAEIAVFMDQAFGRYSTILNLLDDSNQVRYNALLREQPFPQPGTSMFDTSGGENPEKLWSFLGTRIELDEQAIQRLSEDGPTDVENEAYSPAGLDMMAVLGSKLALDLLPWGESEIERTQELTELLRTLFTRQINQQAAASARDLWLQSFWGQPGFLKGETALPFPDFGLNPSWERKVMNSALGAWVEFRSESTNPGPSFPEIAAAPERESPPSPAFVEPSPGVFYSLARLAFTTVEGLQRRGLDGDFAAKTNDSELGQLLSKMLDLGDRLQRLGDIAGREIAGERLTPADYALIQAPLGLYEEQALQMLLISPDSERESLPPLPNLGTLDFGGDRLMHVATGGADRIYMLVPLEGQLMIAQGGVYSYFEFSVLRSRGLDAQSWQWRLENEPPDAPTWLQSLYLEEGTPIDVLAYRSGDLYRILPAAGTLSLRSAPGRDSQTAALARAPEIFRIIDGPREANGLTWWKIEMVPGLTAVHQGWIFETQGWYERAWDQ